MVKAAFFAKQDSPSRPGAASGKISQWKKLDLWGTIVWVSNQFSACTNVSGLSCFFF